MSSFPLGLTTLPRLQSPSSAPTVLHTFTFLTCCFFSHPPFNLFHLCLSPLSAHTWNMKMFLSCPLDWQSRWKLEECKSVRSSSKRKTYLVVDHTYRIWFKLRGYEELAKTKGTIRNQQTHSGTLRKSLQGFNLKITFEKSTSSSHAWEQRGSVKGNGGRVVAWGMDASCPCHPVRGILRHMALWRPRSLLSPRSFTSAIRANGLQPAQQTTTK